MPPPWEIMFGDRHLVPSPSVLLMDGSMLCSVAILTADNPGQVVKIVSTPLSG